MFGAVREGRAINRPAPVATAGVPTPAPKANPLAGMQGIARGVRERPPAMQNAVGVGTNPGGLRPNGAAVLGNKLRGQDMDSDPRADAIRRLQATLR